MNRKEDLQQFFISANSAQNRHDFDLDNFTEKYLQRNPRSFSEYKEQCNISLAVSSAFADALYKETNTYLRRAKKNQKNKNAPQMYIDDVFEMIENTKDIIDKKFNKKTNTTK